MGVVGVVGMDIGAVFHGSKARRADTHEVSASAAETLLAAMRKDKKASDGRLTFVLVRGVGEAFVARDVPEGVVAEVLAATA